MEKYQSLMYRDGNGRTSNLLNNSAYASKPITSFGTQVLSDESKLVQRTQELDVTEQIGGRGKKEKIRGALNTDNYSSINQIN